MSYFIYVECRKRMSLAYRSSPKLLQVQNDFPIRLQRPNASAHRLAVSPAEKSNYKIMQSPKFQSFSLKEAGKQRFKQLLIQLRQDSPTASNAILVIDPETLKIISCFMKMSELLEQGVNAVESLQLARKPFQLDAIYFVQPTVDVVQKIAKDFSQDPATYKQAHIIFNNKMGPTIIEAIQKEQVLVRKIASCKVINLDFLSPTERTFSLEIPRSLDVYKGRLSTINEIALKLSTLLVTFEKFYTFEFIYRATPQNICRQVAQAVNGRMLELLEALKKSQSGQYDLQKKECGKIRVLILDRALDPLSPLLHDFYYQAMFYDLLDIKGDKYTSAEKTVLFSDADELFCKYKYRHIAEVLEGISTDFQTFVKTNSAAKLAKDKDQSMDLKQMTEIMRSMPLYKELMVKYTIHMEIVEKSLDIFRIKELPEIGELEQTLATGLDKKGSSIAGEKILQRIVQVCQNRALSDFDKLRLVLAAIIQIDVVENDRKQLMQQLNPNLHMAILNLKFLGVTTSKATGKSHKRVSDHVKTQAKNKMASEALELCRNTPIMEQVVQDLVQKDFVMQGYEKLTINEELKNKGEGKSLRQKGRLAQLIEGGESTNETDKLVIFCIGGVGYNEVRSLMNNQAISQAGIVIVGGTRILKPNEYAEELSQLDSL